MTEFLSDPGAAPETFAEPGSNRSFAQSVFEAMPALKPGGAADPFGAVADAIRDVAKRPGVYGDIFTAAERQTRLVDTASARGDALAEAADIRINIARERTGAQLENPFRQGYFMEAQRRYDDARARGEDPGPRVPWINQEQQNIFNERFDALATSHPDQAGALSFYAPLSEQAKAIASGTESDTVSAWSKKPDPVAGAVASFAGGLWGSRRDPMFVTSLFAGPTTATGKAVISRIASSGLSQGFYNMGLALAEQPTVQQWRAEVGQRSGVMPALENVGMAFLFGLIPGAGLQGVKELSRPGREAFERVVSGTGSAADAEAVAKGAGFAVDPEATRAAAAAERGEAAGVVAQGRAPAGVAVDRAQEVAAQAVRHGEDPTNTPPQDLLFALPDRPKDQARILDESVVGRADTVDGKPVKFERFDPSDLKTDAGTFQYKGGGDSNGVTDRLNGVTRWDPTASGKAMVFETLNGERFVADGHQRQGLAKRLQSEGQSPKLDGFLFREADGWTPADVRALAAKKNMQEGSGDALDAARILRERPDLLDGSLPVSGPTMRNGIALARLSDEAFGMTLNGAVPPNYAAAVGSMVRDPLQHVAIMNDLVKFQPETERAARLLIGDAMASGFTTETQINLFGAADLTRSLMGERVKVLERALSDLTDNKKLFGTLGARAQTIEGAAANSLDKFGNQWKANQAARLADMLTRLAQRKGPISDALNRAAAQVAKGVKPGKASGAFLDEVETMLRGDVAGEILAEPRLQPAVSVEPGTAEAAKVAETALAERTSPALEPIEVKGDHADLFDAVAVSDRADGKDTKFLPPDVAHAQAQRAQDHADLVRACKD